jgi:hypothetical protein
LVSVTTPRSSVSGFGAELWVGDLPQKFRGPHGALLAGERSAPLSRTERALPYIAPGVAT